MWPNRGLTIKHVEKTWFLMEIFAHFGTASDKRTTQTDRSSMYCSSSKWPLINGPLWGYFLIPERKLATLRDKFSWEDLPAEANLLPKISSFSFLGLDIHPNFFGYPLFYLNFAIVSTHASNLSKYIAFIDCEQMCFKTTFPQPADEGNYYNPWLSIPIKDIGNQSDIAAVIYFNEPKISQLSWSRAALSEEGGIIALQHNQGTKHKLITRF